MAAHNTNSCSEQIHRLLDAFNTRINPFKETPDKNQLYNITSGQAAPPEVADFLLTVEEKGEKLRETFIDECRAEDQDAPDQGATARCYRFERPISRNKIENFSTIIPKKKLKMSGKVQEVKLHRDLFGRLLGIAMSRNLDLEKVLTYPLTPVPLSMCHLEGSICKTDKWALAKCLDTQFEGTRSSLEPDTIILDGLFILQSLKDLPATFGSVSLKLLQHISSYKCARVDVIFDTYSDPSIQDVENARKRSNHHATYKISGPKQERPSNFNTELQNPNFRQALIAFIIDHWRVDEAANLMGSKSIYINFDKCYEFKVGDDDRVWRCTDENLTCQGQSGADTKMIFHLCRRDIDSSVEIMCSSTDTLVILLGNMQHLQANLNIAMRVGIGNSQRLINVTELYAKLDKQICAASPGFHAFTGCDANPSFSRKAKRRPFSILKGSTTFQEMFTELSREHAHTNEKIFEQIEDFICQIYSVKKIKTVNEARLNIFTRTYKPKNVEEAFQSQKVKFDGTSLPPCQSELRQQVLRSIYLANIWRQAHEKQPVSLEPENFGWTKLDNRYEFNWFEGDEMPTFIGDVIIQPEQPDQGKYQAETKKIKATPKIPVI